MANLLNVIPQASNKTAPAIEKTPSKLEGHALKFSFDKKLSEAIGVWNDFISPAGIAKIKKAIKEVIEAEIKPVQKSLDKK